jgi:hypothetical protein
MRLRIRTARFSPLPEVSACFATDRIRSTPLPRQQRAARIDPSLDKQKTVSLRMTIRQGNKRTRSLSCLTTSFFRRCIRSLHHPAKSPNEHKSGARSGPINALLCCAIFLISRGIGPGRTHQKIRLYATSGRRPIAGAP